MRTASARENAMQELLAWIDALDAASAFLFALPFVVAFAALSAEAVRRVRHARRSRSATERTRGAQPHRDTHAWG